MKWNGSVFAAMLKYWRGKRGLSQLDLALNAEVSTRHLSCLETGRSRPSDRMVLLLCVVLDVPLRERNTMLQAAGFEPFYEEPVPTDLFDEHTQLGRVLKMMLERHAPYPMVIMDQAYDIIKSNHSAQWLMQSMLPTTQRQPNAVLALFDPKQVRPYMNDWEHTARAILCRLQRESLLHPHHERLHLLIEEVFELPDIPPTWRQPDFAHGAETSYLLSFSFNGLALSFVTTIMKFDAPQNVTVDELQIESYFPWDDITREACLAFGHG